ncbi:MAG: hypothetical protein J0I77_23280 [Rudaea sp.]|nr:hypothetical protein [Rudaea sp. 3F27F6]MBN8888655.1 hypothetical protein [Rudaea sp.]
MKQHLLATAILIAALVLYSISMIRAGASLFAIGAAGEIWLQSKSGRC